MNQGTPTGNDRDGVVYDEGSIDLMGFVARHRSLFMLSTIIAALLTVGGYAITQALPGTTVASYEITLSFKGAAQGQYPNKSPFSPQDLIGTNVLEPIWKAQGLEERIELADLARAVTISRSSRDLSMLQSEYAQKLANTKLTAAERQVLEGEFKSKLDALAQTDFTITCAAVQLSPGDAERFVLAVPAEWARLSEAANSTLYALVLPKASDLEAAVDRVRQGKEDIAAWILFAETLRDLADRLLNSMEVLQQIAGSELQTASSGQMLVDLQQQLTLLHRNLLMPAYVDVMTFAQQKDPSAYRAITEFRRKILESKEADARARSEVLHNALRQLGSDREVVRNDPSSRDAPGEGEIMANVDGTFIDRMIQQAVQNRDVDYRRSLSMQAIEADLQLIDDEARLNFQIWIDEVINGRENDDGHNQTRLAESTERMVSLSNQIADLADRTREILGAVSKRNLNPTSVLYQGDIAPVVMTERLVSTRTTVVAGVGLWFALLGLSALAGAVQDRRRALN